MSGLAISGVASSMPAPERLSRRFSVSDNQSCERFLQLTSFALPLLGLARAAEL
jgi:hypothetical protein